MNSRKVGMGVHMQTKWFKVLTCLMVIQLVGAVGCKERQNSTQSTNQKRESRKARMAGKQGTGTGDTSQTGKIEELSKATEARLFGTLEGKIVDGGFWTEKDKEVKSNGEKCLITSASGGSVDILRVRFANTQGGDFVTTKEVVDNIKNAKLLNSKVEKDFDELTKNQFIYSSVRSDSRDEKNPDYIAERTIIKFSEKYLKDKKISKVSKSDLEEARKTLPQDSKIEDIALYVDKAVITYENKKPVKFVFTRSLYTNGSATSGAFAIKDGQEIDGKFTSLAEVTCDFNK